MTAAAQARRLYHHALNGGAITPDDMARLVERIEAQDAEVAAREQAAAVAERQGIETILKNGSFLSEASPEALWAKAVLRRIAALPVSTGALDRLLAEAERRGMERAAQVAQEVANFATDNHHTRMTAIAVRDSIRAAAKEFRDAG